MSSALLGYSQSVTAFRFEHGRRTCYYGSEKYDTEGDMFYLVLDSDSGEILDIYNQKRYKYDA